MKLRRRRIVAVLISAIVVIVGFWTSGELQFDLPDQTSQPVVSTNGQNQSEALDVLQELDVKGRAPKTGYARDQFGSGWTSRQGCDTRNVILNRDLTDVKFDDNCLVLSGKLDDPYTGKVIEFYRGLNSREVQIDHVVALSDAWQKGAQGLSREIRIQFANDPINLLAVDGPANQQKGDSDAASWLPSNKSFRCQYVARQVAIKAKYSLWVTVAEKQAIEHVLGGCPGQGLPTS